MQGKRMGPPDEPGRRRGNGNGNQNRRDAPVRRPGDQPVRRERGQIPPQAKGPEGARKRRTEQTARRRKIAYRTAIAVLAVILALLIGVAAWWKTFIQRPEIPDQTSPGEQSGEVTDIPSPIRVSGDRKEDFFTFLVIGRDTGGGGNTDTILLAAYDIPNQRLNVMSIPRDTMVNVPWEIKKINSVYNVYGRGEKGIEALDKEIAQLVGFVPDFQVVLEWKAVGELVDALGGVTFDVPQTMRYRDPEQDLVINVQKGQQVLNGDLAMQVVRFRSYPNGDLGRVEVQQSFLKEVVKKCLRLENMTKVNSLAKVFTDNVTTNLKIEELAWLADKAIFGGLNVENVNFVTMPNELARVWSPSYRNYQSYVVPKTDELVALVNERFNPYLTDLDTHELDIMHVRNGVVGSSTGKVEDKNANASKPPPKTEPSDNEKDDKEDKNEEDEKDDEKPNSGTTNPGTSGSDTTNPSTTQPGVTDPDTPGDGENQTPTPPAPQPPLEPTPEPTTEPPPEPSPEPADPVPIPTPEPAGDDADAVTEQPEAPAA